MGAGPAISEGKEIVFEYAAFNEAGRTIDTSSRTGRAARARIGIGGLIPGFEVGKWEGAGEGGPCQGRTWELFSPPSLTHSPCASPASTRCFPPLPNAASGRHSVDAGGRPPTDHCPPRIRPARGATDVLYRQAV